MKFTAESNGGKNVMTVIGRPPVFNVFGNFKYHNNKGFFDGLENKFGAFYEKRTTVCDGVWFLSIKYDKSAAEFMESITDIFVSTVNDGNE